MPCIPSARDITIILYPVGIATMDTHRILENKEKQACLLLETDTQSRSLSGLQLERQSRRTSDGLVTEGCGQIDTTIEVWPSIIDSRSQETKLELLLILETSLRISMHLKWLRSIKRTFQSIDDSSSWTPPFTMPSHQTTQYWVRYPAAIRSFETVYRALSHWSWDRFA